MTSPAGDVTLRAQEIREGLSSIVVLVFTKLITKKFVGK